MFGIIAIFVTTAKPTPCIMSAKKRFSIPKNVTLTNASSYITAVEEAVEREIEDVPVVERRLVLATVMSSLQIAENTIHRLLEEAKAAEKALS